MKNVIKSQIKNYNPKKVKTDCTDDWSQTDWTYVNKKKKLNNYNQKH